MSGAPARLRDAPRTETACAHCALPVPPALVVSGDAQQFCCQGCRTVHRVIHQHGLQQFYVLRDDRPGVPASVSGRDYATLDHPSLRAARVARTAAGQATIEFFLEGVHCAACVWLIEKLPHVLPGVVEARVDAARRTVRVIWDDGRLTLSAIARRLDALGYPCHTLSGGELRDLRRLESRKLLARVAVAGAIAGNTMLVGFALFGGMVSGMEPQYRGLFRWTGLALTLLALAWPGRAFFVRAASSLRTRTVHMDLPVAVALAAGTLWGGVNTVLGTGETYFESLTMVVFLLLVGRWLVHERQRSAQDALERRFCLTPSTARLIEEGRAREVPIEALRAGALVELRAGDAVPADGTLARGRSTFDCSLLSGESVPVERGPGDRVFAGTTNLGAPVILSVETTGSATRVGRLAALVDRLARERAPIVLLADRVAQVFVIVALGLAALTVVVGWRDDPAGAVENAIALLIVTCPCALGLATPLAVAAALGQAARRGILIKGGAALEALARPGVLLLDKTGTLTRGRARLAAWRGDETLRPLVLGVESRVHHPIARAFVEAFGGGGGGVPPATQVRQTLGGGVEGEVAGRHLLIGSPAFARARGARIPDWAREAEAGCIAQGLTPVLVAAEGEVAGVAGFGDPLREEARPALERLRGLGWRVEIVSGDAPAIVGRAAGALGLDPARAEGGASPERKCEIVRERLAASGPVVMVGDGVNDAAALAAASVGVAVHGGAEASLTAADVFLGRPGLDPLVRLVEGARRTMRVIRLNVGLSLVYNAITAGLAMAGRIDPLLAAALMPLSSLTVVTRSYRARTFQD